MKANIYRRLHARATAHDQARAIAYILVSTAAFSLMNASVHWIGVRLNPGMVVSLRTLITLLMLLPFVAGNHFAMIRTTRLKDHALRGIIGAFGMISWTYCLTIMPLNHATALSFTAPLLASLFAILVLKETAHPRHFYALGVGFIGTLIILRPAGDGFAWNSLLVIVSTSLWATVSIFVKSLSRTEPAMRMVFYMNLFMFLVSMPIMFMHWQMPNATEWLVIVLVALCSIAMHFTMVKAYSYAPVVTLMPFDFMRLVYTSLLAYFLFGETSDFFTWLGSAIIVGSVVLMARRDAKVTHVDEPV